MPRLYGRFGRVEGSLLVPLPQGLPPSGRGWFRSGCCHRRGGVVLPRQNPIPPSPRQRKSTDMSKKKVWFVTGAGRGLGVDIARAALAAGHAVVATARNAES